MSTMAVYGKMLVSTASKKSAAPPTETVTVWKQSVAETAATAVQAFKFQMWRWPRISCPLPLPTNQYHQTNQ